MKKNHKNPPHSKAKKQTKPLKFDILHFLLGAFLGILFLLVVGLIFFEQKYQDRVYPGIRIGNIDFENKTKEDIIKYWQNQNQVFLSTQFTFKYADQIATISGAELDLGYDATLSATQALSIGRSANFLTNTYLKLHALSSNINLKPLFKWNTDNLDNLLNQMSQKINIEPVNALFEFNNNRVSAFKPSSPGKQVNIAKIKQNFADQLELVAVNPNPQAAYEFILPVEDKLPLIRTEQANDFGIKETIGEGISYFAGSIPGRIHNVALAASRINGVLIPPDTIFSFNDTVGDISAATGYKQAYVIKSGRTVLDDGGGVCQVSTTLFRAALNAGLPIVERHAHSYRVGYYEQGGWKPGFDATVYDPSYDLKIKNDTGNYILIQANTDTVNLKLTFTLYGVRDDRVVNISAVRLWDSQPAPADLYQDDPTLPNGTIKQVDWAATGIKTSFNYEVTKNGQTLTKDTFYSNFVPWQAVFLRGTKN